MRSFHSSTHHSEQKVILARRNFQLAPAAKAAAVWTLGKAIALGPSTGHRSLRAHSETEYRLNVLRATWRAMRHAPVGGSGK